LDAHEREGMIPPGKIDSKIYGILLDVSRNPGYTGDVRHSAFLRAQSGGVYLGSAGAR